MIVKWIRQYIPASVGVAAVAVLSFLAGQIVPSYFDYASEKRASIVALIEQIEDRGDALERAIAPVMTVAMANEPGNDAVVALNDRVLDLFQAVEYVQKEFPDTTIEREAYVASLVKLREVSSTITGLLDAPRFIEAASEFKQARTVYESRVASLEPNFFSSLAQGLR